MPSSASYTGAIAPARPSGQLIWMMAMTPATSVVGSLTSTSAAGVPDARSELGQRLLVACRRPGLAQVVGRERVGDLAVGAHEEGGPVGAPQCVVEHPV